MEDYLKLKKELNECIISEDIEMAHSNADDILKRVALDMGLTLRQRRELISLYDKVTKWYF